MENNLSKKTLCITGGHLTPALAVIEEIQNQGKPWNILFVGRQRTSQGTRNDETEEKKVIERMHIPFFPIRAGKIQRYISLSAVREVFFVPIGLIEACIFCLRQKPDVILSFGGYVGFPVVIAGWLLGIPVIIHEQTHILGLANKIAAQIANKVLVTFNDTKGLQQLNNAVITGLPIRKSFFHTATKPTFPLSLDKPILYITGGATGSVSLNNLLFPSIARLVSSFTVIHQTGKSSYEKAVEVKKQLKKEEQDRYIPSPYFESEDVAWIMQHMLLLVGRSGANTTVEISLFEKPAIFVPLPWAANNEQMLNALWYQQLGYGSTVEQRGITPELLLKAILDRTSKIPKEKDAKKHIPVSHAAATVVREVASVL